MSSSSDDRQPPSDMSWLHDEPTSIGERPPRSEPPAPPAPPAPAATKPEPPTKVRGLFGKQSIPPPPAGRGPLDFPRPGSIPAPTLPSVPVIGAPELPPEMNALDDPLSDLFDGSAEQVVIEQVSDPSWNGREDPTLVPTNDDYAATIASSQASAQTKEDNAQRTSSSAPVAKLELAKTMLAGAAHELPRFDSPNDPRAEHTASLFEPPGSTFVDEPRAETRGSLDGVVFDPDQSVARHLGERAIDDDVGPSTDSEALRDLPLPQVKTEPSVPPPNHDVLDAVPVRSSRSALLIIGLVLFSGGAATLVSLGVMGGPPSRMRPTTPAKTDVVAPVAASSAAKPPVAKATTQAPPTQALPTQAPTIANKEALKPEATGAAPVAVAPVAAAEVVPAVAKAPPTPAPVQVPPAADPVAAGDAALREGELDRAAAYYQAGLDANSRDHHAMEGLARVHLARGEATEAVAFAEEIVKRRSKRAAYRVLLGQALGAAGDRAGARQAFQAALALEPDNRDAQRLLGQ